MEKIYCLKCDHELKPLGLVSVACSCASFSVGLDDISAEAFYGWPVTMLDIKNISRYASENEKLYS